MKKKFVTIICIIMCMFSGLILTGCVEGLLNQDTIDKINDKLNNLLDSLPDDFSELEGMEGLEDLEGLEGMEGQEGEDKDNENQNMQGYTGTDGADLKKVDSSNYTTVAKALFGLEIKAEENWIIKEAKSPNGVNNLNITFTVPTDVNGKSIMKSFFEQSVDASNGVYAQNINWDTMSVSKGDSYTDFEAFYQAEATEMTGLLSAMWIYDFGGKSIQFSFSLSGSSLELSMVFLG